ncbi:major histocompatibility complex class I-related gene protein-like [Silurus meridionalis]|uniref:Ig-like domain-containing protein n=1 Tax=Silurus meridionalis TaxID=175797 RepID=A0A8T0AB73_SILME|nr:major histocompatibility complex class I-related gene protein-like [Silurus meridionalis]KAF7687710.1 hypothetical protein HF521_014938 [Silurus meridionalis]
MNLTSLMNILFLLFTLCGLQGSAVTHSVQYLYTMLKPQLTFSEFNAVGLLDGEQFMSYNSTTRMLIAEDWIKKIEREELWKSLKQDIQGHQDGLNKIIKTLLKVFVNITDVHTLQRMYGCEVDDGNTSGYDRYGYNGEDLMSLELKTATWIAANDKAELVRKMWDPDGSQAKGWKTFLENDCSEQLKRYMSYGKESVERKVPPTMSMFKTPSSSSEVVCHATGFFPRALNISWLKDGQNVYKDLGKTLPNLDGSFQKRSILEVSTEELQKHNYTCVIEHSSLEKDLVLVPVSECRTLKGGGSQEGVIGFLVGNHIIIFIVIVGILVWKRKKIKFCSKCPSWTNTGHSPVSQT